MTMSQNAESNHIVMLNKAYPPWVGGIERHVRDISEALVERGWPVSVLVCNESNYNKTEILNGVNVVRVPRLATCLSQPIVRGFFPKLRELKPALVHVHVPFPLGWFAPRFIPRDVPLVCSWHSDIIRQRFLHWVYGPFEQRFLDRCNRILPTSLPLMEHSSALSAYKDKCRVLPLAVHEESFPAETMEPVTQRYEQGYSRPIVLFVGRLVGYKGLEYLVRAMESIEANLLIAGFGPQRSALEKMAERLAPNRVHFLGHVSEEEKTALYRLADVFVLPSVERSEAFGYVLLEAMQQGCPVITTDLPTGVKYVNQHGQTGLVVPPRDVKALAEAIQTLLSNKETRQHFAKAAQDRVKQEFEFQSIIERLETEYRDLLK
ncbi:glycosyltransferase [bacterium]|nr:glycosyltransferase [bacterium]